MMAESPPTLKPCQFESLRKCPSPSRCNSKQTWYSRRPPNALKAPPGGAKDSEMSDSPRKGVGNGVLHSKLGMGLGGFGRVCSRSIALRFTQNLDSTWVGEGQMTPAGFEPTVFLHKATKAIAKTIRPRQTCLLVSISHSYGACKNEQNTRPAKSSPADTLHHGRLASGHFWPLLQRHRTWRSLVSFAISMSTCTSQCAAAAGSW